MIGLATLLIGLLCLYLLSREFIKSLYDVLFTITKSHKKTSYALAIIFFPGTFIHEVSHFLAALLLLVPVYQIKLFPEITKRGVRMGSVGVGKSDLFRNSIIGVSPFVVGVTILLGIVYCLIAFELLDNIYFLVFMFYVIFQITHTMFTSKQDLHAVAELSILLVVLILLMVAFDILEPFIYLANLIEKNSGILEKLSLYLFVPILIEIALVVLLRRLRKAPPESGAFL